MSRSLGKSLPPKLYEQLRHDNAKRENTAIFLVVRDDDGFPHAALLSPYQVVAPGPEMVYVGIHGGSRTEGYLRKWNIATLIVQVAPAVFYIKCRSNKTIEWEHQKDRLYSLEISDVLEDYSESAPFISELRFSERNVMAHYSEVFENIRKYAAEDP